MRRAIVLLVVATVAASSSIARADSGWGEPRSLPSIGWFCWAKRARADFDGDGTRDVALVYHPSRAHGRCGRRASFGPTRLTVLLGPNGRIDRRSRCLSAFVCDVRAADFDHDGRFELLLETDGGAAYVPWVVFRVTPAGLTRLRLRPLLSKEARLDPGPLVLEESVNSATRDGFGCRTHPTGVRLLVVWRGWLVHRSQWRIVRSRLRFDGSSFSIVGIRRHRAATRPLTDRRWPPLPHVQNCSA